MAEPGHTLGCSEPEAAGWFYDIQQPDITSLSLSVLICTMGGRRLLAVIVGMQACPTLSAS